MLWHQSEAPLSFCDSLLTVKMRCRLGSVMFSAKLCTDRWPCAQWLSPAASICRASNESINIYQFSHNGGMNYELFSPGSHKLQPLMGPTPTASCFILWSLWCLYISSDRTVWHIQIRLWEIGFLLRETAPATDFPAWPDPGLALKQYLRQEFHKILIF